MVWSEHISLLSFSFRKQLQHGPWFIVLAATRWLSCSLEGLVSMGSHVHDVVIASKLSPSDPVRYWEPQACPFLHCVGYYYHAFSDRHKVGLHWSKHSLSTWTVQSVGAQHLRVAFHEKTELRVEWALFSTFPHCNFRYI